MYEHMFTSDGAIVYPSQLDSLMRQSLRQKEEDCLYCSCSDDERLYYRISSDLRIYPAKQGYVHNPLCCRYDDGADKRKSHILINDNGNATIFMKFKPDSFSISTSKEDDGEAAEDVPKKEASAEEEDANEIETSSVSSGSSSVTKDKKEKKKPAEKEPGCGLEQLVCAINWGAYTQRVVDNKNTLSADYFLSSVKGYARRVKIAPFHKTLGEFDLAHDGFAFYYANFCGYELDDHGGAKLFLRSGDKTWSYWTYAGNFRSAMKQYERTYARKLDAENNSIMIAGFLYRVKSKKGTMYNVAARILLFETEKRTGLYCPSGLWRETFSNLFGAINELRMYKSIRLYLPQSYDDDGTRSFAFLIQNLFNHRFVELHFDGRDTVSHGLKTIYGCGISGLSSTDAKTLLELLK